MTFELQTAETLLPALTASGVTLNQDQNVLIRGCRYSGKSHASLAVYSMIRREYASNSRRYVEYFGIDDWLRHLPDSSPATSHVIDVNLVSAIHSLRKRSGETTWVLDDADIALASVTEQTLNQLQEVIDQGQLNTVMIRNRLVDEDEGWLADRENDLLQSRPVQRYELNSLDETESIQISQRYGVSDEAEQKWLAEWSGGIAGLIHELQPFAKQNARSRRNSAGLKRQINVFASQFNLATQGQDELLAAIQALDLGILPPRVCLTPVGRRVVGYLTSIGMVSVDYERRARHHQGNFWGHIAGSLGTDDRLTAAFLDAALPFIPDRLAELIDQVGMIEMVSEEFGIPPSRAALAAALAKISHCESFFGHLCAPLYRVVADLFGRLGVRSML